LPDDQIRIDWTDASVMETGYELQRSPDPAFAADVTAVGLAANTVTTTQDWTFASSTDICYYRLRSFNANGNCGWKTGQITPVTTALADNPVAEGQTVTVTLSGRPGITLWTVDFGDGSDPEQIALTDATLTHVYSHGSYTLRAVASDGTLDFAAKPIAVTVTNVAPVLDALDDQMIQQNDLAVIQTIFHDPGFLNSHTASISWGDGTTEAADILEYNGSGSIYATHVYAAPGVFNVSLTITDDSDATDTASAEITVANTAPVLGALLNQATYEGQNITLATTFSDADPWDTHTASIYWGDGATSTPAGTATSAEHTSYGQADPRTILIRYEDADGILDLTLIDVAIYNVVPTATLDGDETVNEGAWYTLALSATDPGQNPILAHPAKATTLSPIPLRSILYGNIMPDHASVHSCLAMHSSFAFQISSSSRPPAHSAFCIPHSPFTLAPPPPHYQLSTNNYQLRRHPSGLRD
jgi:hypothetical protein